MHDLISACKVIKFDSKFAKVNQPPETATSPTKEFETGIRVKTPGIDGFCEILLGTFRCQIAAFFVKESWVFVEIGWLSIRSLRDETLCSTTFARCRKSRQFSRNCRRQSSRKKPPPSSWAAARFKLSKRARIRTLMQRIPRSLALQGRVIFANAFRITKKKRSFC